MANPCGKYMNPTLAPVEGKLVNFLFFVPKDTSIELQGSHRDITRSIDTSEKHHRYYDGSNNK